MRREERRGSVIYPAEMRCDEMRSVEKRKRPRNEIAKKKKKKKNEIKKRCTLNTYLPTYSFSPRLIHKYIYDALSAFLSCTYLTSLTSLTKPEILISRAIFLFLSIFRLPL